MKKILQVFASLNMGGAESRMMDVYRKIDRERFCFDFLTMTEEEGCFEKEIVSLGGKVLRVAFPTGKTLLHHISVLRKIIREGKYTAVHAHTSYHSGLVMLAAAMEHVPVRISHARTTGSKREGISANVFRIIGKFLIRLFATKRVAISETAGKFLFGHTSFEVIPNAIDLGKYGQISSKEIESIRADLKIPANSFVIGQIGRFDPMKNHSFTINWFCQYTNIHPNAFLAFVGDGALRCDIEKKVKENGLSDKVLFTGIRRDVPQLISAFDVLIFPSTFEGLGGVVLEAQAAGIPTVESDSLPHETDMGLGLVHRCALSAELSEWNEAVRRCAGMRINDRKRIRDAFLLNKYSIEFELSRLEEIYRG